MDLSYGLSSFDRINGNFPSLPVINMVAEEIPTEEGMTLQSRFGLDEAPFSMGTGPVKTLFQIDGVLNNEIFGISGSDLYSSTAVIGTIDGTGPAKIAGYTDFLFTTAGSSLWGYDGTTLAAIATPDDFEVLDLCVGGSRLIVIDKGTGKIYWTDALAETIDSLNFATAENSPDKLKACLFIGDTLLLFGSETVEIWPISGDATAPFAPLPGRTYQVGVRDTGCATKFTSTFAWVTDRNQVCISNPETVVSNPSLDAKLTASDSVSLWSFILEGVEYLAVTMDTETWVFSPRSKTWSEFKFYGEDNWLPRCYVGGYFGSFVDGTILVWTDDYSDSGGTLERRFRAGTPITSATVRIDNLTLRTNPGHTPYIVGDYANPVIELRTSKDGGYAWTSWKQRTLGAIGKYRHRVTWRSLGMFGYPGFLAEIRVTDPVPFRVSGVKVNEPYGGI